MEEHAEGTSDIKNPGEEDVLVTLEREYDGQDYRENGGLTPTTVYPENKEAKRVPAVTRGPKDLPAR